MSDVVIVGAGPTGLTLACELARRGLDVRVVDRSVAHGHGSRGKTLNPRSLEVLADLGVGEVVAAVGLTHLRYRKYYDGVRVSELDPFAEPGPTADAPYDGMLFLPQWRLEEILRDRLAAFGVKVELGTELTGLRQADGKVAAAFAGGGRAESRYLVGCDGGRSTVRKLLGVSFEGKTASEQSMICGDVEADGLDPGVWHQWFDREGAVLLSPFRDSRSWQIQADVERDADGTVLEPSLAGFQRRLDLRAGETGVRLRNLTWSSTWRVNVRMVDRYRAGNVFLAGDAAHVHPIAGGLGMNTGIQDAWNLGWKLALAAGGRAGAELLDTYQEERLPIAAWTLDFTGTLLDAVGEALEKPGVGLEKVVTDEGRGLRIGYRWSSLARGRGTHCLEPGDRAPDAPCHDRDGRAVRFFEVFAGPHFTLLGFGAGTAAAVRRLAGEDVVGRVVEVDLIDSDRHARRAYGIDGDALVLVRPDNHVAMITEASDADGVLGYLRDVGAVSGQQAA
ncbi:FAD-dependent oxidoreductase [Amycolatopsis minnesotensis]|uniref:FAD-dependent oxidoreductase n=1 Tax=Amycolatopsis minnesotensis TaxID=337894 RepID=A0ABN2Q5C0_9PSEU